MHAKWEEDTGSGRVLALEKAWIIIRSIPQAIALQSPPLEPEGPPREAKTGLSS